MTEMMRAAILAMVEWDRYPEYVEMMRDAIRRADIPLLMNMPEPEEWSRQQREKAEAQTNLQKQDQMEEKSEKEDSEISVEEKHDKHLLVIKVKNGAEKEEHLPKTKNTKLKALKMLLKSKLKDDIREIKKKHLDGKGTLSRNIHIMNKDTTRIDLTVQIEIMQWTRHTMKWIMRATEGEEKATIPGKKKRSTKAGSVPPEVQE